jgi:hypothetical protein
MITILIALLGTAGAANLEGVDADCRDVATQIQDDIAAGKGDYDDVTQADFLLNYFAMAATFSPLHAPIPGKSGTGTISLELAGVPPLGCERRLVLGASKTEDTNKTIAIPRPRLGFVFNKIGPVTPYGSFAYVPPVTVFGTRNVIVSGEAGFGAKLGRGLQWGMRYHFTLMKTIAEIATPFNKDDEEKLDFYMGSTFGLDAMFGKKMGSWTPYLALGFTDASTFFYIGDDAIVGNNGSPYAGLASSLGVQYRHDWLDLAAEAYGAPGAIYTGRLRAGASF